MALPRNSEEERDFQYQTQALGRNQEIFSPI